MAAVRKLKTQTETFWRDEYRVTEEDLDLVTGAILESGRPQPLAVLASTVILRRIQQEREAAARQAASGDVYQPKGTYTVGQQLIFSALDFTGGKVTAIREGHNPRYGEFRVIRVAFADGTEREYASDLDAPHPLNRPAEELLGGGDPDISDADIVAAYSSYVAAAIEEEIQQREEYVPFSEQWYLRELLPELNVGHLNLAEAVIDTSGHPMAAADIVHVLDLGAVSESAQLFALNSAMAADARFDNVSRTDNPVWYLKALQPKTLHQPPAFLQNGLRALGAEYLGLTLLDLVDEIGDELDDLQSVIVRERANYDYEVVFPHLYAGTMPAMMQFLNRLPVSGSKHFAIELVDEHSGQRLEVWVVPERRYVCGLEDWYRSVDMSVGGRVAVRPTDDPMVFTIAASHGRERRSEFVRTAVVAKEDLDIQLPTRRTQVHEGVDPNMHIGVPDGEALARFMELPKNANMPIGPLVRLAFNRVSGLSGTGEVHAKTVYSVANLIRRTGAVPVFAELTRQACFDPVGEGRWAYNRALEGKEYDTPDTMRERPLSTRDRLLKDQAIPYTGR